MKDLRVIELTLGFNLAMAIAIIVRLFLAH